MKKIIVILITILGISGCYKEDKSDLSNKINIRGKLYKVHPFTNDTSILAGVEVMLQNELSDTVQFIYSRKTDDNGIFYFNVGKENENYKLYARVMVDGIHYSKILLSPEKNKEIKMVLPYSTGYNNLLFIETKDEVNDKPLPNTQICFFSNPLFYNDTVCTNSAMSFTTDASGSKFIILPKSAKGTYYLKSQFKINDNTILRYSKPDFILPATGFTTLTVKLK